MVVELVLRGSYKVTTTFKELPWIPRSGEH